MSYVPGASGQSAMTQLVSHRNRVDNPHVVTLAQLGAASAAQGALADSALQTESDPVALAALVTYQADQQVALAAKMDTETALSMLADVQGKYDDLNQQFLLLLRFVITTFGQVPKGLEDQLEAAIGA